MIVCGWMDVGVGGWVSFMFAAVPQVVQSGSQSIEMAVLETGKKLKVCV